jgi:diaminohydroxyphosphoribosylaminopyrimidine deaminase/5-amino-6-(5-phosphoribosylamino)uracil reductase
MRRALRLAARGRGQTSPNPMVGASVVSPDGVIVGDGWHQKAGTPHAEVHALEAAGARAVGATLVCTLEPCCHHGRTGPCVERILTAGIARVVVATEDPNPLVAGGGLRYLADHGVDVTCGVEADAARMLNAPFFTMMRSGRPWVILKAGVSLDGYIASAPGIRSEITGPAARRDVQRLRAEVDAVAIGSGTVLVDNPWLTVRDVCRTRPQTRVVFDRRLRTPPTARVLASPGRVLVLARQSVVEERPDLVLALRQAGAEVVACPTDLAGGFRTLGDLGIQSVLLEGGATLNQAAWDAGMIDEVRLYVSPEPLGAGGVPLFAGAGWHPGSLVDGETRVVGRDTLVHRYVHRPD